MLKINKDFKPINDKPFITMEDILDSYSDYNAKDAFLTNLLQKCDDKSVLEQRQNLWKTFNKF